MRFFEIVVSGAALISSAFAVTIDTYPSSVEAGKTYTITYSPKDAPATFILRKGLSTDLTTIATIGTGNAGTFTWQVSSSLPNGGDYALQVKQGSEENYSGQFPLTGGSNAVSSASAAASSASAAVSSIKASASSVIASITSAASASASVSPSGGANTTVSTATLSRTASTSRPASTTGSSPPQSTGAASMLSASPLAIILGAVAAFAYLN
ncbi:hypothetical protein IQ06DRAFT_288907 [Phaeosphaeriaceae sp. SRC1lsM3a]|nr:hypothetical protein IQ06DRAFT_288907 [Stagonospora sp. SRC1lsM3a]